MNEVVKQDIERILSSLDDTHVFYRKTILISGAAGFLPAYLAETFMAMADEQELTVIALVRTMSKAEKRFGHLIKHPRFNLIEHDITQPYSSPQKLDFIIHAASQASPKYYGQDPVGTLNANVLGTIHLINLAREHRVESFLFFSSGEVYGEVKAEDIPIKEDTFGYLNPATVRACYGESKRMGENICVSYHAQFGVNAKIVRPFHTYGPGMALNDGRVFADFVANVVRKENIVLMSDGSAIRPFCYLADATLGFLTVLIKGENGQAYNIGNPEEEHSILELASIISELFPERGTQVERKHKPEDNTYLKSPIKRNSPDIEKVKKLGWKPQTDVKEGFRRTIMSFLVEEKSKN